MGKTLLKAPVLFCYAAGGGHEIKTHSAVAPETFQRGSSANVAAIRLTVTNYIKRNQSKTVAFIPKLFIFTLLSFTNKYSKESRNT